MFALGWLLQSLVLNRVLGKDILPPLLVTFGLSVALQNGLLEAFSADSRRIPAGALERASLDLGLVTIGVMPLLTFASAILAILALNGLFYHTALGRAFRATSDDPVTAGLMGIEPKRSLRHGHRHRDGRGDARGALSRHEGELRSLDRAGAADLCLRGGHHRRPRKPVGHARRAGSSSALRRRSAPRSIRNGRSWRATSAFLAVMLLRPRGLFPRAVD